MLCVSAMVAPATPRSPTLSPASRILRSVLTFAPSPTITAARPPGVNDRATVPNQPSCSRCHASLNARGSARSARLAPISPEVHASGHDLSSGTTVRRYPSPPGTMSRDEDSDLALDLDLSDVVAVPEAAVAAPLPARTFRAKER